MRPRAETDAFIVEGKLALPYSYFAGRTGSKFLIALRDERRILGLRCPSCEKVFVPPRKTCEKCFQHIGDNWVELGNMGTVTNFTIVHYDAGHLPQPAPLPLAMIRLDGADTPLLHRLKLKGAEKPAVGMRVRAVFAEKTTNTILDIDHFAAAE